METEKLIKELGEKFTQLEAQNEWLAKENARLRDEHYKDEELARLKSENEQLHHGFSLSKKEEQAIREWQKSHDCPYQGTRIGGIASYRFDIISGIGYIGYVRCTCGKEFCFCKE